MLACHLLRSFFFPPLFQGGRPPGPLAWGGKPGRPGFSWSEPGGSRWPGGESPTLGEIPGHIFVFAPFFFPPLLYLIPLLPLKGRLLLGVLPRGVSQGAPGSTRIDGEPGGSQRPGGESPTLGEIPGHVCVFWKIGCRNYDARNFGCRFQCSLFDTVSLYCCIVLFLQREQFQTDAEI